ncbi:response regulator [Bordetella sp. N]|uniref:response regulator n=1 Tax=Bordetella sp. N TaxID=1746199 RepID=UPI00070C57A5|nr:response regulator [Bordetella sp. N]ALM85205.1 two-component system response regulator [Bordetella sp. N]
MSVTRSNSLVLIVEDELDIFEVVKAYVEREGFSVVGATDGASALTLHGQLKPDLVLLDVQLPIKDGWQVLAELRTRSQTPVIMLTALDQDADKLLGLRIGADDYIEKPFNPAEVAARVRAVLRRSQMSGSSHKAELLRVGPFTVDIESHEALVDVAGEPHPLPLTPTEFNLLSRLMKFPRKVFSRDDLLVTCLPEGETMERTVDSHISKLRRKLQDHGITGFPEGVRGIGYRLGVRQ